MHPPPMAPPALTTWQERLVGWRVQAQQYTSGAIVRGHVQSWDASKDLFVLNFENGSVEPAYLPQPSVLLVDQNGMVIDFDTFFHQCLTMGVHVDPQLMSHQPQPVAAPTAPMQPPMQAYAEVQPMIPDPSAY